MGVGVMVGVLVTVAVCVAVGRGVFVMVAVPVGAAVSVSARAVWMACSDGPQAARVRKYTGTGRSVFSCLVLNLDRLVWIDDTPARAGAPVPSCQIYMSGV